MECIFASIANALIVRLNAQGSCCPIQAARVFGFGVVLSLGLLHAQTPVSEGSESLAKARTAFEEGKLDVARTVLEKTVKENPKSTNTWLLLAQTYSRLNLPKPAIQSYCQVLKLKPDSAQALYNLGVLYLQEGSFKDSADLLGRLHRMKPDDEGVYAPLLHSLLSVSKTKEADQVLADFAVKPGASRETYFELAKVLLAHKACEQASALLSKARNAWPDDTGIRRALAASYQGAGHCREIIALLGAYPGEQLATDELRILLDCYMADREWTKVEPTARAMIVRKDAGPQPFVVLANLLQLRGEDPEVVRLFEQNQPRFASDPSYLFTLAMSHYNMGNYNRARSLAEDVIRLQPDLAQAQLLAGHCLSSLGRREEALPFYQAAVDRQPQNSFYHFHLGLVLSQIGQKQRGEQELQQAVSLNPSHAPALFELATLYNESGRLEEARLLLEKAVAVNPDFESPYYLLSRVYAKLGRSKDAQDMLAKFKQVQEAIRQRMRELKESGRSAKQP